MKRSSLKTIFIYFLVGLGLLQPIGMLLKWNWANMVGRSWGISPAPVPFSNFNGYEVQNHQLTFRLISHDGLIINKSFDKELLDNLEGPDLRRTVFFVGLSNAPVIDEKIVHGLLKISFCGRGALLSNADLSLGIQSVEYLVRNKALIGDRKFKVRCSS